MGISTGISMRISTGISMRISTGISMRIIMKYHHMFPIDSHLAMGQ